MRPQLHPRGKNMRHKHYPPRAHVRLTCEDNPYKEHSDANYIAVP